MSAPGVVSHIRFCFSSVWCGKLKCVFIFRSRDFRVSTQLFHQTLCVCVLLFFSPRALVLIVGVRVVTVAEYYSWFYRLTENVARVCASRLFLFFLFIFFIFYFYEKVQVVKTV